MKVELHEKHAFIDLGDGNLLCIGTRDEVHAASIEELNQMILEAVIVNQYHEIANSKERTVH